MVRLRNACCEINRSSNRVVVVAELDPHRIGDVRVFFTYIRNNSCSSYDVVFVT